MFCTVPQHDSISLHLDKTPPPLITSIFHEEGRFSSLVVFSCTELHIILHLAESRIDPALYLISMHYNVLVYTVHAMRPSLFEIKPLGGLLWMLHDMNCNASPCTV